MSQPQSAYRIAWIGPETGPCDYVLERFIGCCNQMGIQPHVERSDSLELERARDCDRILLTSNNRALYPDREVATLMTTGQIVPWGVVTGSWHLGSRRSGQGIVTHWQQPWFRWWDSWLGWFFPEVARPGSLVANGFGSLVVPLDYAMPPAALPVTASDHRVAILSACRQTADMLTRQAVHSGWTAQTYSSWDDCLSAINSKTIPKPELVVWDDSLLPCLPGIDLAEAVEKLFSLSERLDPTTRLVASLGFENIQLWSALSKRGWVDMLVKPSAALGLSNYLFYQALQRQVA